MRNREQFSPDENETDIVQGEENQEGVETEDETQEKFFDVLTEKLGDQEEILTDEALLGLLKESFTEAGAEGEEEELEKAVGERPLIFYRAMRGTEDVDKLLSGEDILIRPFSYTKPGKWSPEREGDVPLSYGGKDPKLLRIIDLNREWEDTAPYWGFGPEGSWSEAMNLDKVVLRKIDERELDAGDIYKEVEQDVKVGKENILQITCIVDKIKTEAAKATGSLEEFINDKGFWDEIKSRAKHFGLLDHEHGIRLNKKYLEFFEQTLSLNESDADNKGAANALARAKSEIAMFIRTVSEVNEEDPNWSIEDKERVLQSFSPESMEESKKILEQMIE